MSVTGIKNDYSDKNSLDKIVINKNVSVNVNALSNVFETNNPSEELDLNEINNLYNEDYKSKIINNNISLLNEYRNIYGNHLTGTIDPPALPMQDEEPGRYRTQGLTVTDKYIYVTAHGKHEDPSIILVYDSKTGKYLGKVTLPNEGGRDSHVGGISYDSENDLLYLTGTDGSVIVLDNEVLNRTIENNENKNNEPFDVDIEEKDKIFIDSFIVDKESINIADDYYDYLIEHDLLPIEIGFINDIITSVNKEDETSNLNAASVYYDEENKKLYIPTFSEDSKVFVYDVTIDEDGTPHYELNTIYGLGEDSSDEINSTNLPYGIQGVATYTDENGEKYLLMTSSYSDNDSCITKYKINSEGELEFAGQKVLEGKKGLENLVVDSETGNIYGNVENDVKGSNHQTGEELVVVNINDIDGESNDPLYVQTMDEMREDAARYDK